MSETIKLGDTVRFQATVIHPTSGYLIAADSGVRYYAFVNDGETASLQGDMIARSGLVGSYRGSFSVSPTYFASGQYISIKASGRVSGYTGWGNLKDFIVSDISLQENVYYANIKYARKNTAPSTWQDYFASQWYKNGSVVTSGQLTTPKISVYNTTDGTALVSHADMSYSSPVLGSTYYLSSNPTVTNSGIPYMVAISGTIDGQMRQWNQIVGLDLL